MVTREDMNQAADYVQNIPQLAERLIVMRHFAQFFLENNSRFNAVRFCKACGFSEETLQMLATS